MAKSQAVIQSYQSEHGLLTREEAAKYTNYSVSRIGDFIREERLPCVTRGRRQYVRRADCEALFEESRG